MEQLQVSQNEKMRRLLDENENRLRLLTEENEKMRRLLDENENRVRLLTEENETSISAFLEENGAQMALMETKYKEEEERVAKNKEEERTAKKNKEEEETAKNKMEEMAATERTLPSRSALAMPECPVICQKMQRDTEISFSPRFVSRK